LIDLANDAPTAARRVNLSSPSARALALERFAAQQQLTTSDTGEPDPKVSPGGRESVIYPH